MKKIFTKGIALILILVLTVSLMPSVFAASKGELASEKFSFTVGLGTKFKEIGLPETIYSDGDVLANVTWKEGGYNGEKTGTYTLSGTAKLTAGGTASVTAYVTVKDCGFRLPHMAELITGRTSSRRNRGHQSQTTKIIGLTPLFDDFQFEDYVWTYRWYVTSAPGVAGELYSTDKDCSVDFNFLNRYYYCKVTGTKDGVSTTLTSRYVYVLLSSNEDLMCYKITTSVDEIVPGEDFNISATAALRFINGAFDQFYYSGVDNYIPHFTFSSTTPGVTFSEETVIAPRGVANVTVHTPESAAQYDTIDLSVHVKTVGTSKIYYTNLVIDNIATASVRVVEDAETRKLTDVTDEWYADGVRKMLDEGYMSCRTEDTFGANEQLTRAELINTLYRIDGFSDVKDIQNIFDDVPADADYVNAVLWARNNKIMNGTSDFMFSPDKTVSRQDFATILYRACGEPKTAAYFFDAFSDTDQVSEYALDAMRWATNSGVLKGNGGKLLPNETCTRAMAAQVLARYFCR